MFHTHQDAGLFDATAHQTYLSAVHPLQVVLASTLYIDGLDPYKLIVVEHLPALATSFVVHSRLRQL
jgi:hypothetical protein